MKYLTPVTILILNLMLTACNQNEDNFIQYVDPFIGTSGHGHTYPGATTPYGMVQLSPDNGRAGWDWSSGYHWSDSNIIGFSHTHLSGTGVGDLCDVLVTPTNLEAVSDTSDGGKNFMKQFMTTFSHSNEKASPGYYSVILDNGIKAELTATPRCGFHKYTGEGEKPIRLVIDLGFAINNDKPGETFMHLVNDTLVTGYRYSGNWAPDQWVYFAVELSRPVHKAIVVENGEISTNGTSVKSKRSGMILSFSEPGEIFVKAGISSVSEEGAIENLRAEIPDWGFEKTKNKAVISWNNELKKLKVRTDNEDMKTVFYTALYHSMLAPNLYSDTDGKYLGYDGQIHSSGNKKHYYTFSLWDTFRALHPFMTIWQQERTTEMTEAMMRHFRESPDSILPVWTLWGNETWCMIGYHSIPVLVDAYFKGLCKDDPEELFFACKSSLMNNRAGMDLYKQYGYIPADQMKNSVSKTLEYAYNDWCIAQLANDLGKNEDYEYFLKRSENYKNVFDTRSTFMRGKLSTGEWNDEKELYNSSYRNDYTEGNAWQYTWFVPHDPDTLISLMGGNGPFVQKLDKMFETELDLGNEKAHDISGLIGQYVHGNEPAHHISYLYNYAGQPWKTQQRLTQIMHELYTTGPDGLCGNEDCGQMSAWYLMSAMGFYPVNPASGVYDIGRPFFDEIKVDVGNGKEFIVLAHNLSEYNIYVQEVKLNGENLTKPLIRHADIVSGGRLEFFMGNKRNEGFLN